jgi:hypothetical protein
MQLITGLNTVISRGWIDPAMLAWLLLCGLRSGMRRRSLDSLDSLDRRRRSLDRLDNLAMRDGSGLRVPHQLYQCIHLLLKILDSLGQSIYLLLQLVVVPMLPVVVFLALVAPLPSLPISHGLDSGLGAALM